MLPRGYCSLKLHLPKLVPSVVDLTASIVKNRTDFSGLVRHILVISIVPAVRKNSRPVGLSQHKNRSSSKAALTISSQEGFFAVLRVDPLDECPFLLIMSIFTVPCVR